MVPGGADVDRREVLLMSMFRILFPESTAPRARSQRRRYRKVKSCSNLPYFSRHGLKEDERAFHEASQHR
jgi:hypothetical protein